MVTSWPAGSCVASVTVVVDAPVAKGSGTTCGGGSDCDVLLIAAAASRMVVTVQLAPLSIDAGVITSVVTGSSPTCVNKGNKRDCMYRERKIYTDTNPSTTV